MNELLNAPCCFCNYNGPGYWQSGTHDKTCPWHSIGGGEERAEALPRVLRKLGSTHGLVTEPVNTVKEGTTVLVYRCRMCDTYIGETKLSVCGYYCHSCGSNSFEIKPYTVTEAEKRKNQFLVYYSHILNASKKPQEARREAFDWLVAEFRSIYNSNVETLGACPSCVIKSANITIPMLYGELFPKEEVNITVFIDDNDEFSVSIE